MLTYYIIISNHLLALFSLLFLFAHMSSYSAEYGTFDILSDETVRAELKKFSDWPTYPQLYVEGKFMGGLDIIQVRNLNDYK